MFSLGYCVYAGVVLQMCSACAFQSRSCCRSWSRSHVARQSRSRGSPVVGQPADTTLLQAGEVPDCRTLRPFHPSLSQCSLLRLVVFFYARLALCHVCRPSPVRRPRAHTRARTRARRRLSNCSCSYGCTSFRIYVSQAQSAISWTALTRRRKPRTATAVMPATTILMMTPLPTTTTTTTTMMVEVMGAMGAMVPKTTTFQPRNAGRKSGLES